MTKATEETQTNQKPATYISVFQYHSYEIVRDSLSFAMCSAGGAALINMMSDNGAVSLRKSFLIGAGASITGSLTSTSTRTAFAKKHNMTIQEHKDAIKLAEGVNTASTPPEELKLARQYRIKGLKAGFFAGVAGGLATWGATTFIQNTASPESTTPYVAPESP